MDEKNCLREVVVVEVEEEEDEDDDDEEEEDDDDEEIQTSIIVQAPYLSQSLSENKLSTRSDAKSDSE